MSDALRVGASVGWTLARVRLAFGLMAALGVVLPFFIYPVFLMDVLCMALFASAFNLLLGYAGLLSFGHAAFLGAAGYLCGQAVKAWGFTPELGILFRTSSRSCSGARSGRCWGSSSAVSPSGARASTSR